GVGAIGVDGGAVIRRSWWSPFGPAGSERRTRRRDPHEWSHSMLKKTAIVTAAVIGGALLATAPAVASNAGTTVHMSIQLVDAGASLSCGATVLTATGGTA